MDTCTLRLNTDESSNYLRKKTTITEIGKAFHEIMSHFEKTRDHSEKKRIGSDMTNPAMGHLVRGQFCSALATLLLDGLRPYRLEGLVQDDIWKVTLAFCNEGRCGEGEYLFVCMCNHIHVEYVHLMDLCTVS